MKNILLTAMFISLYWHAGVKYRGFIHSRFLWPRGINP